MEHKNYLALLAAVAVCITACKKDTEDPVTPEPEHEHHHATVRMDFDFMLGENPYTFDSVVTDGAGHKVKFSAVKFFISGAHAVNDLDEVVGEFPEAFLLLDAGRINNDFTLGEMEAGHVHEIEFNLGLDSVTNHTDPTTFTEAPLNDINMHWSWNPDMGYKFLVLEGRIDGNNDGLFEESEPLDVAFELHATGDDLLTRAHIHTHHTLTEGEIFTAQGGVDLTGILDNVDVTMGMDLMGTTTSTIQAMNNLAAGIDGVE